MQTQPPRIPEPAEGLFASGIAGFVPGVSTSMRALETTLEALAVSDLPILVTGEAGVGKRTMAFKIHQLSRLGQSFLEVSCADWNQGDSAHSPANGGSGHFKDHGTIFLEEVPDLSADAQAYWVSALQRPREGDSPARVVASSTRSVEEEVRAGRFREDLLYLLARVCLRIPPLRHRREDIAVLTDHFLESYAELFGRPTPVLSADGRRFFLEYSWPGNVRELENATKTIVALGDERAALAALRSSALQGNRRNGKNEAVSLKQAARAASRKAERELMLKVLSRTRWNRKRAARELQISYKALLYKLKQMGLQDELTNSEEILG